MKGYLSKCGITKRQNVQGKYKSLFILINLKLALPIVLCESISANVCIYESTNKKLSQIHSFKVH